MAERQLTDAELEGLLRDMVPADVPPPGLRARTLAAAGGQGLRAAAPRRRPRPIWAAGLATAAAAAVAAAVLALPGGEGGELELRAALHPPASAGTTATAEVRLLGTGREIHFRTTALPILPKGAFYELWFASPRDRPGRPDRISAGTFHPDAQGRSDVRLTAAVDPAHHPTLIVTAEPGDGDPRPSADEVLRSG
jgi:hypothetical protein